MSFKGTYAKLDSFREIPLRGHFVSDYNNPKRYNLYILQPWFLSKGNALPIVLIWAHWNSSAEDVILINNYYLLYYDRRHFILNFTFCVYLIEYLFIILLILLLCTIVLLHARCNVNIRINVGKDSSSITIQLLNFTVLRNVFQPLFDW